MVCSSTRGLLPLLLLLLATCAASSIKGTDSQLTHSLIQRSAPEEAMSRERIIANRVLARVLDMTFDMFRDLGASEDELKELHHKRNRIQTCYFQAISCY